MADKTIYTTIKLKRQNSTDWDPNYILKDGEPGFELDTGKLKIGDNVTPWGQLNPIVTSVDLNTALNIINNTINNIDAADVNAVPNTRTINNISLQSDIELYANNIQLSTNDSTTVAAAIAATPTQTSDLTNDSGFITSNSLPTKLSDLTNDLSYDNAPTVNSNNNITSGAVYNSIDNVIQVANGKTACYVFDTEADMILWLAENTNKSKLKTGDVLLIRVIDVPDYWWDGTANNGAGDVYRLETTKVDLSGYVQKSGDKVLSDNNYSNADQTKLSNLSNITSIGAGLSLSNGELSNNKIYASDIAMSSSDATKISAKINGLTAADVGALPSSTDLTTLGGLPKPNSTTANHYAIWDGSGNIIDSGYKIVISTSTPTVNDETVITFVK